MHTHSHQMTKCIYWLLSLYKSCKHRKHINQICPSICSTQQTILLEFDSFHMQLSSQIQFNLVSFYKVYYERKMKLEQKNV